MEKLCQKCANPEEISRELFARLLWSLFPKARSENELAELVAEMLGGANLPIHSKTVRNWLRCDNAPAFRYIMFVISVTGPEALFDEGRG